MEELDHWLKDWLLGLDVSEQYVNYVTFGIDFILMVILAFIADRVTRLIILRLIAFIIKKTKTEYDDIFLEKKVFDRLSRIAPAVVVQMLTPTVFSSVDVVIPFILIFANVYIAAVFISVATSFIGALQIVSNKVPLLKDKPIDSFLQVFKILVYVVGSIIILAYVLGKNPIGVLGAMGAFTAVILLIFKDTILGFVAGIQLTANNMVKIGDWVSMPKYGADGNVIEITLNTVKVQNWDSTITTIPTYAFVSDGVKNWRNMSETGGRRIKRSIHLKIDSVKMCTKDDLAKYEKYELIKNYIHEKQKEIDAYNHANDHDKAELINGRNLTNIGIFREYALRYLKNNKNIHQDRTVMVRQLPPGDSGIPLELYAFANDTAWVNYENIQGDIFDHLLAVAPHFDLEVFQNPTGKFENASAEK